MTRDEAIGILWIEKRLCHTGGHGEAADFVDKLEALGLITLDQPKLPSEKLAEALGLPPSGRFSHGELTAALDKAGLCLKPKEHSHAD